jgi:hypothetical protein
MLNVVMLNVVMLNVVMLSVVAPNFLLHRIFSMKLIILYFSLQQKNHFHGTHSAKYKTLQLPKAGLLNMMIQGVQLY